MSRIIKDGVERRGEILDAAQRFIYTKGYEQMTIQDILDAVQISKGAFYHYFSSKQELLEALVERLQVESDKILAPIMQAPDLPALKKLEAYFATLARWKSAQKDYLMELLRIWYTDENAIVRDKVMAKASQHVTPLIVGIVRQGIQEGVFDTPHPDQAGDILLSLLHGMVDRFALDMLAPVQAEGALERATGVVLSYTHAIERVLGAQAGSLHLMDREVLAEWFAHDEGAEALAGVRAAEEITKD